MASSTAASEGCAETTQAQRGHREQRSSTARPASSQPGPAGAGRRAEARARCAAARGRGGRGSPSGAASARRRPSAASSASYAARRSRVEQHLGGLVVDRERSVGGVEVGDRRPARRALISASEASGATSRTSYQLGLYFAGLPSPA